MSVLIRGMEMPQCCEECILGHKFFKWLGCNKHVTGSMIENGERSPSCPLIEVPPHGRLIDADALMKEIQETCKRLYGTDDINAVSPTLAAFKLYIGEAPTIIEAEE